MQLTQKESALLKDLKNQEKLCVEKYTKHASEAQDPQLKNLFSQIAQVEQGHLNTVTQMEQGSIPAAGGGQSRPSVTFVAHYAGESTEKAADQFLCTDLLTTEKHASHLYDTCIFEFQDEASRNVLNHIQKEEQEHGKMIYDYMQSNNMYG